MSNPQNQVPITDLAHIATDFLDLEEVATILGVSLKTVRRMTQESDPVELLPSVKIGGGIRVHRQSLVEHLNRSAKGVSFFDPGYTPPPLNPALVQDWDAPEE